LFIRGKNIASYSAIKNACNFHSLLKAFKARADHIENLLKEIKKSKKNDNLKIWKKLKKKIIN
jgi:hypothetical protein